MNVLRAADGSPDSVPGFKTPHQQVEQPHIPRKRYLVYRSRSNTLQGDLTVTIAHHRNDGTQEAKITAVPMGPWTGSQLRKMELPGFTAIVAASEFGTLGMGGCQRWGVPLTVATARVHGSDDDLETRHLLERLDHFAEENILQPAAVCTVGPDEGQTFNFERLHVKTGDH